MDQRGLAECEIFGWQVEGDVTEQIRNNCAGCRVVGLQVKNVNISLYGFLSLRAESLQMNLKKGPQTMIRRLESL